MTSNRSLSLAPVVRSINSWIVSLYKVFGMLILLALVLGMTAFIALQGFFLVNRSWAIPMILDSQHEKVTTASLAFHQAERQLSEIKRELLSVSAQIRYMEYAIELQKAYQENFVIALATEKKRGQDELKRLGQVKRAWQRLHKQITPDSQGWQSDTSKDLQEAYESRLIDKEALTKERYLSNQIAFSELSQTERRLSLAEEEEKRKSELEAQEASFVELQTRLIQARTSPTPRASTPRQQVSLEVIEREQRFMQTEISRAELQAKLEPLLFQKQELEKAVEVQQDLVSLLAQSAWVRAAKDKVIVSFVSYENSQHARIGSRLWSCELGFIICRPVGTVKAILDGEVTQRHPLSNQDLRGRLLEITIANEKDAEATLLLLHRPPLFI